MDVIFGPYKEGWATNYWQFQIAVLEQTLEIPLDSKEIKSINPNGNELWIFIGRTVPEAEAPTLWPPDKKSQLIRKNLDARFEGKKRRGQQRMRWLDSITITMGMNLSKLQEIMNERETWHAAVHGVAKGRTQLTIYNHKRNVNWTFKVSEHLKKIFSSFLLPVPISYLLLISISDILQSFLFLVWEKPICDFCYEISLSQANRDYKHPL